MRIVQELLDNIAIEILEDRLTYAYVAKEFFKLLDVAKLPQAQNMGSEQHIQPAKCTGTGKFKYFNLEGVYLRVLPLYTKPAPSRGATSSASRFGGAEHLVNYGATSFLYCGRRVLKVCSPDGQNLGA